MTELFDENKESNGDNEPETVDEDRRDFEIKQAQESNALSGSEVTLKTITPQKLENSRPHEFLTRDALLSNLDNDFDVEVGGMYHSLACYLQWMELNESAQYVDSCHTAWLDHTVGKKGFGRRLLSTTTIDKTQKVIKEQEAKPSGMQV